MRWTLLFLLTYICGLLHAQENKTWIGDTSIVKYNTHEGDTYYIIKSNFLPGQWRIYYDPTFKHSAYWIDSKKYDFADTNWYRNGQVKSWKTPNDSCWNCYGTKEWFSDGNLKSEILYRNDTCFELHYYQSGSISEKNISWRDSASHTFVTWHYHVKFYENGQMKALPVNPNSMEMQREVTFYESGKKMSDVSLIQGALVGEFIAWHENGIVKIQGQYTELRTSKLGMPTAYLTGTWSYYNESGILIKEEFYEDGQLVKTIEY